MTLGDRIQETIDIANRTGTVHSVWIIGYEVYMGQLHVDGDIEREDRRRGWFRDRYPVYFVEYIQISGVSGFGLFKSLIPKTGRGSPGFTTLPGMWILVEDDRNYMVEEFTLDDREESDDDQVPV